jgi:hypothetical protein
MVAFARFLVFHFSMRRVRRILTVFSVRLAGRNNKAGFDDIMWAFSAVNRRLVFTCLMNALAAHALLTRYGHPVTLRIGAARGNGSFAAHAWIEKDGEVVMGGPASFVEKYVPFPGVDELAS